MDAARPCSFRRRVAKLSLQHITAATLPWLVLPLDSVIWITHVHEITSELPRRFFPQ